MDVEMDPGREGEPTARTETEVVRLLKRTFAKPR
jgi:hypothetical protein